MTGVYQLRDAIAMLRNSGMSAAEWAARPGRQEHETQGGAEDLAFAYQQRWKAVMEARSTLDPDLLHAEALWGDALKGAESALDQLLHTLTFQLFRRFLREKRDPTYVLRDDQREEAERVVWSDLEAEDPFGSQIQSAIRLFEGPLTPHLRSRRWRVRAMSEG
jgi:hypothetical protein